MRDPLRDDGREALAMLADLIEKRSILELVQAYSRAVDRRDFELLESLYTEDGIDDHAGLYCGPAAGFVSWLEQALANVDATTHQVHQVDIALDGQRAQGEVYLTAYNRIRNDASELEELTQGLRYLDHYRRDAGAWRFERRTVVCDWARSGPAFWDPTHPLLAGKRFGAAGAADPSYEALSHPRFERRASAGETGPGR